MSDEARADVRADPRRREAGGEVAAGVKGSSQAVASAAIATRKIVLSRKTGGGGRAHPVGSRSALPLFARKYATDGQPGGIAPNGPACRSDSRANASDDSLAARAPGSLQHRLPRSLRGGPSGDNRRVVIRQRRRPDGGAGNDRRLKQPNWCFELKRRRRPLGCRALGLPRPPSRAVFGR